MRMGQLGCHCWRLPGVIDYYGLFDARQLLKNLGYFLGKIMGFPTIEISITGEHQLGFYLAKAIKNAALAEIWRA